MEIRFYNSNQCRYNSVLPQRGVLLSPGIEWESSMVESTYSGSVKSGWINDQGDFRGNDLLGSPIDSYRSFIRAHSINRPQENWRGWPDNLNGIKIPKSIGIFKEKNSPKTNGNDSFGEITYEGEKLDNISSYPLAGMNQYESAVEQIPSLRIDLAPTPLGNTQIL